MLKDYISIARPDHWVKHIFILPGLAFALMLMPFDVLTVLYRFVVGLASACCIASANYVINEWLDAEFDRHHPLKKNRPAAAGRLQARWVYLEYFLLTVVGLVLAYAISPQFLLFAALFWFSGVIYNVRPLRTKERPFLDVLSEAINNPLRLMFGWCMVADHSVPPLTLLLVFWFGGAFLMSIKRLAEYRHVVEVKGKDALEKYRVSFKYYSEQTLLQSGFLYAILATFFMAIFLVKYRHEYILSFPFFAALFTYYLRVGLQKESIAQAPEKLYQSKGLMVILLLLVLSVLGLTFYDIDLVEPLFYQQYEIVPSWQVKS